MKPRCGPVEFGDQDWSQFDFSRWHLDGLRLDDPSAALANLAEQLLQSPEWRQNFVGSLPGLKVGVRQYFEQRSEELRAQAAELNDNLEERTTNTRGQITALQERMRNGSAPPVLTADPNTFQLGAKVLSEETRLGLPGLVVRLTHPQQQDRTLAESITDLDGNAVLYLTREQAEELAREKIEATVVVLGPAGKVLHREEQAICPRPNHTETWVASLSALPDLEPHTTMARQINTDRELYLASLNTRIDHLQADHATMQHNIESHLADTKKIIDGITAEQRPEPDQPPLRPSPEAPSPEPEPTPPRPTRRRRPRGG
jgi:hypothetical protein